MKKYNIKKIKRVISYGIVLFFILYIVRNPVLRFFTKGWEKESFVVETTDYKLSVNQNLTQGCPKRNVVLDNDTLEIIHYNLPHVLKILTDRHENNLEMKGDVPEWDTDYNLYFYLKDSTVTYENYLGEILDHLGDEFGYTYSYDTLRKKIYYPEIIHPKKLLRYETNNEVSYYSLGENYMGFEGNRLESILKAFTRNVKGLYIKPNIDDSLHYQMRVPSSVKDKILSFFQEDVGIQFIERDEKVEMLTFDFKE